MPKDYDGHKWYVMTSEVWDRGQQAFVGYRGSVARRCKDGEHWQNLWTDATIHPTRGKARTAALRKRGELERDEAPIPAHQD